MLLLLMSGGLRHLQVFCCRVRLNAIHDFFIDFYPAALHVATTAMPMGFVSCCDAKKRNSTFKVDFSLHFMPVEFLQMMVHVKRQKKNTTLSQFWNCPGHGKKYDTLRAQIRGVNCQIHAVTDSNPPNTLPKQGGFQVTEATLHDLTNSWFTSFRAYIRIATMDLAQFTQCNHACAKLLPATDYNTVRTMWRSNAGSK